MERAPAAAVLARLHRALGQLYAGGSDTDVRAVLTPDVSWHVPGDNAIAGHYHGIAEVLTFFRRRRDLAGGTLTMSPRNLLTGQNGHVAAVTDGTATLNGQQHSWSTVGLYRISEDRIAECWLLPLAPQQFDAIWAPSERAQHPDVPVPASVFRTSVRPRHCDAQGGLHAARYYELFEDAFLDWLDAQVAGYAAVRETGTDLVVVASGCEHHRGATLLDRLSIEVRPVAAGRSSLAMAFTVQDDVGAVLAIRHTTYVSVSAAGTSVALPELLRTLARKLPDRRPERQPS